MKDVANSVWIGAVGTVRQTPPRVLNRPKDSRLFLQRLEGRVYESRGNTKDR